MAISSIFHNVDIRMEEQCRALLDALESAKANRTPDKITKTHRLDLTSLVYEVKKSD